MQVANKMIKNISYDKTNVTNFFYSIPKDGEEIDIEFNVENYLIPFKVLVKNANGTYKQVKHDTGNKTDYYRVEFGTNGSEKKMTITLRKDNKEYLIILGTSSNEIS